MVNFDSNKAWSEQWSAWNIDFSAETGTKVCRGVLSLGRVRSTHTSIGAYTGKRMKISESRL